MDYSSSLPFKLNSANTDNIIKLIDQRLHCLSYILFGSGLLPKTRQHNIISKQDYHSHDLICCNADGTYKCPQTVFHQFKKLLRDLGLPSVRLHDLRHTCATLLSEHNVPLQVISQSLGHSKIGITADTYLDVLNKQQTADVMQGLFGKDDV